MKKFIHGSTYYSHAHPSEELSRNFRKMSEMGINTVRVAEIWPGWSVIEYSPGKYDFSILDDYVEKAVKNGLSVCMGVGINDTPFWLFEKYRDLRFKEFCGKRTTRRVQAACIDHKEYREHMKAFIEEITKHYSGFKGISAWQFGNEIRYNVQYCDCDATRVRFRKWLRCQYDNNLETLNNIWGVYYHSWDEIYPYKSCEGPPTEGIAPHCIKTQQFQSWSLEELVHWGVDIMKKHTDLPVFHNNYGISGGSGSHWRISEACDITVIDIYANTSDEPGYYNGFMLDTAKSIALQQGKELWIGETPAGQYGTYSRNYTDRRIIENFIMEDIGAGASAIFYFRHKAPVWEQPHKFTGSQTYLRIDESELEYAKTPINITEFIKLYGDRVLSAKPVEAEVGIYFPSESIEFGKEAGYYNTAYDSAFGSRALWAGAQIPVEIIDTAFVCSADLSRFKIIYMPISYLLPRVVGKALKEYVAMGGTLICEARPAYSDENGLLYKIQPGAELDEVFGAREDLFYNTEKFMADIKLGDVYETLSLLGLKQTYRLTSGTPILYTSIGKVCGVYNKYGKGHGYIIGGAPSLHYSVGSGKYDTDKKAITYEDTHIQRKKFSSLFNTIGRKHGVTRPIPFECENTNLTVRYLENKNEMLMFCINYSNNEEANLIFDKNIKGITMISENKKEIVGSREISVPALGWKIVVIPKY